MYAPYCVCCKGSAHWSSDWDASDYGFDCEGIIGLYICSNCGTHIEVRDLYINKIEERSIKYYVPQYEEDDEYEESSNDVDYCLYCNSTLVETESKPYKEHEDDGEGVFTKKECPHCDTIYEIQDIYPLEDIYIYPEDYLTVYDLRTVFVK